MTRTPPSSQNQQRNRQWILRQRPIGDAVEDALELREAPLPQPADGQALVQNLMLSLDPTHRIWMSDIPQYMPPVELGAVMRGGTIGRVISSRSPRHSVGDIVAMSGGWQDYCLVGGEAGPSRRLRIVEGQPLSLHMGLLSHIGATAYVGLLDLGQPKTGDTVVVSGAAGAVGSLVVQIAKLKGCRVIAIAGGPAKCRWLVETLKADAALDYRSDDLVAGLKRLAPEGVNVYFDNTGGDILDAVLQNLALNARIPLCGLISEYNRDDQWGGPRHYRNLLMKRATVRGFIVSDHADRFPQAFEDLARWHADGKLVYRVDEQQGLEQAPTALKRLFNGSNEGKLVIRIAE